MYIPSMLSSSISFHLELIRWETISFVKVVRSVSKKWYDEEKKKKKTRKKNHREMREYRKEKILGQLQRRYLAKLRLAVWRLPVFISRKQSR